MTITAPRVEHGNSRFGDLGGVARNDSVRRRRDGEVRLRDATGLAALLEHEAPGGASLRR